MANFCTKCGSPMNQDFGLCPKCDVEKIEKMSHYPNFCTRCGGKVNKMTGCCSACGTSFADKTPASEPVVPAPVPEPVPEIVAEPISEPVPDIIPEPVAEPAPQPTAEPAPAPVPVRPAPAPVQKQPAVKPAVAPKAPKVKKKSAGIIILTIFISILLFAVTFVTLDLFAVRATVSDEDNIEVLMDDAEVSDVLSLMGDEYEDSFYETLCEFIKEETGAEVTKRNLEKLVKESSLKSYLSGKMSVYIDDVLYNDNEFEITQKEVRKLLNKNSDVIEEELGAEVSEEVLDAVANWIVNEDIVEQYTPSGLKRNIPGVYYAMNVGLSPVSLIVLCILILLLLFVIIRWNVSGGVLASGIVMTIVGGLHFAVSVMALWMPGIGEDLFDNPIFGSAFNLYFGSNILLFGIVMGVGVLALIVRGIVKAIVAKK